MYLKVFSDQRKLVLQIASILVVLHIPENILNAETKRNNIRIKKNITNIHINISNIFFQVKLHSDHDRIDSVGNINSIIITFFGQINHKSQQKFLSDLFSIVIRIISSSFFILISDNSRSVLWEEGNSLGSTAKECYQLNERNSQWTSPFNSNTKI